MFENNSTLFAHNSKNCSDLKTCRININCAITLQGTEYLELLMNFEENS